MRRPSARQLTGSVDHDAADRGRRADPSPESLRVAVVCDHLLLPAGVRERDKRPAADRGRLFQGWEITNDINHGQYMLQLVAFDGSFLPRQYLTFKPPTMWSTNQLTTCGGAKIARADFTATQRRRTPTSRPAQASRPRAAPRRCRRAQAWPASSCCWRRLRCDNVRSPARLMVLRRCLRAAPSSVLNDPECTR